MSSKSLCCLYGNCQASGLVHFLKKTDLAENVEFKVYHNYQLILKEQNPADFMADASKADIFIYQLTDEMYGILSTEQLLADIVPTHCQRISFAYQYNAGFFPVIKASAGKDGWITGDETARDIKNFDHHTFFKWFNGDELNFGCARRFIECLAEQHRREMLLDIQTVPYILQNYRKERLFLTQNHPTSALFCELASQVYRKLLGDPFAPEIEWTVENEANLPCTMPIAQAAVRELALQYPATDTENYYRQLLEQMFKEVRT